LALQKCEKPSEIVWSFGTKARASSSRTAGSTTSTRPEKSLQAFLPRNKAHGPFLQLKQPFISVKVIKAAEFLNVSQSACRLWISQGRLRSRGAGGTVRVEIMRWVQFITIVWPLIGFTATLALLVVFHRPLRRILDRFDCQEVERIKIGPIEIVKQSRPGHTRGLHSQRDPRVGHVTRPKHPRQPTHVRGEVGKRDYPPGKD